MLEGYKIPFERLPSYQLGLKRGISTLVEQAIVRGIDEGIEAGIARRIKKGIEQEKKLIALRGYKKGLDIKTLSEITEISEEEIKKIIEGK